MASTDSHDLSWGDMHKRNDLESKLKVSSTITEYLPNMAIMTTNIHRDREGPFGSIGAALNRVATNVAWRGASLELLSFAGVAQPAEFLAELDRRLGAKTPGRPSCVRLGRSVEGCHFRSARPRTIGSAHATGRNAAPFWFVISQDEILLEEISGTEQSTARTRRLRRMHRRGAQLPFRACFTCLSLRSPDVSRFSQT